MEVLLPDQTHRLGPPRHGRASTKYETENDLERVGEGRRGRRKEGPDYKGTAEEGTPGLQEHAADVPIVLPSVCSIQCQVPGPWVYAFFLGKDVADRKPAPSETVLLYAERTAWREIHNKVYEGSIERGHGGPESRHQTCKGKGKSKPWVP